MSRITYTLHNRSQVHAVNNLTSKSVLAKRVETENLDRFFLYSYNGKVIDPAEISESQLQKGRLLQIEVDKKVYDKYHAVLTGRTRTTYASIERMIS